MRTSWAHRLGLFPFLVAACLSLSSCVYPVLQGRGGKALVEASRLKMVPSFTWPVFAYEQRKPPSSKLGELDRVVVLPFYAYDIGKDYELLGIYSVPSKDGRVTYPLRVRVAWVRWNGLFFFEPENRPDLGAFVFAPGCLPRMLECGLTGGGTSGVYIPDEDSPTEPRRPPEGYQARITCILIPEDAVSRAPRACLSRAGALPLHDRPRLLEALGGGNLRRFADLLRHSSELSDAERKMIRRQLLLICHQAMREPDNKPYLDSFRELAKSLRGL